jgi:hypothetical protein
MMYISPDLLVFRPTSRRSNTDVECSIFQAFQKSWLYLHPFLFNSTYSSLLPHTNPFTCIFSLSVFLLSVLPLTLFDPYGHYVHQEVQHSIILRSNNTFSIFFTGSGTQMDSSSKRKKESVYFTVQTESLNTVKVNFRYKTVNHFGFRQSIQSSISFLSTHATLTNPTKITLQSPKNPVATLKKHNGFHMQACYFL